MISLLPFEITSKLIEFSEKKCTFHLKYYDSYLRITVQNEPQQRLMGLPLFALKPAASL